MVTEGSTGASAGGSAGGGGFAGSADLLFRPVGRVENAYAEPEDPDTLRAAVSRLVLDPALVEGLVGLEPGDRILVLFAFHRAGACELLQHPRGDESRKKRGLFALRSPRRPNPIGVTPVYLLAMDGNVLEVRGLDAIDGTPVLDLKPVRGAPAADGGSDDAAPPLQPPDTISHPTT